MVKSTLKPFFLLSAFGLAALAIVTIVVGGSFPLSTWLLDHHMPLMESFWQWVTLLGDGLIAIPVILLSLWRYQGKAAMADVRMWSGFALAAMLPQLIKALLASMQRPWAVMEGLPDIAGLTTAMARTFPSGHTAIAFFMCGMLAFHWGRRPYTQWLLACLAMLIGLSRMTLFMHWSWDVVAGGLLALLALRVSVGHQKSLIL